MFFSAKILKRKGLLLAGGLLALLVVLFAATVRVDVNGHYEGVYFLKGDTAYFQPYELTDDVLLGEENRFIAGMSWDTLFDRVGTRPAVAYGEPHLDYEWYSKDGEGFVRNIYPDGKQLLTCFSRFRDVDGSVFKGVFVGGGLPFHEHGEKTVSQNDTGMAFFDGKQWQHLWCNVNESIAIGMPPAAKVISPSRWELLGSRVVEANEKRVILESSHRVAENGVELRIDRFAIFQAGAPYFILVNRVRNAGGSPGNYFYVYGDEPWLGDYGTSAGNVGWVKDRLFPYEGEIDPAKYSYFGMVDSGNKAAGEGANFSGVSNFIEWLGVRPDLAYFSNKIGTFAPESAKVPLASPDNRVLFLQWGPRLLQPGESDLYVLAIGMAGRDPKGGVPVKPQVQFDYREFESLLARKGLS